MKRHETDVTSLVFGLVFLAAAAVWPLWRFDVLDADALPWFGATCLVIIGLFGVALSLVRGSREAQPDDDRPPTYDQLS